MNDKTLRLVLTYLCSKHEMVVSHVDGSGRLMRECLISEAVAALSDSLAWSEKQGMTKPRKSKPRSTPTTLSVRPETHSRLAAAAKSRGISVGALITAMVDQAVTL